MYIDIYRYIYTHIYMHTNIHTYMYVYMCIYILIRIYICMYIYVHVKWKWKCKCNGKCSCIPFPSHNIYSALLQRIEHCSTRKSTCRLPICTYIYIYKALHYYSNCFLHLLAL